MQKFYPLLVAKEAKSTQAYAKERIAKARQNILAAEVYITADDYVKTYENLVKAKTEIDKAIDAVLRWGTLEDAVCIGQGHSLTDHVECAGKGQPINNSVNNIGIMVELLGLNNNDINQILKGLGNIKPKPKNEVN